MDDRLPARPIMGAAYMLGAGFAFAIVNVMTPIITYQLGVPSTAMVFWQYLIATIFALPLISRIGFAALKTRHPFLHELRAFVVAAGIQVFAFGFALAVPVWQMVALSMTAPFFVIVGSIFFLGEKPTWQRITASAVGFAGALMCQQIGADGLGWTAALPVSAAALWAIATVLTKYLARAETPESLTLYMLILITPNQLLLGFFVALAIRMLPDHVLPGSLATGFDFGLPHGNALLLVLVLGLVTAASQYFLSLAYKVADAMFLQPFDDLKLPLNTLIGWIVLSQIPAFWFWPGAALILGASLFILLQERVASSQTEPAPFSLRVGWRRRGAINSAGH